MNWRETWKGAAGSASAFAFGDRGMWRGSSGFGFGLMVQMEMEMSCEVGVLRARGVRNVGLNLEGGKWWFGGLLEEVEEGGR